MLRERLDMEAYKKALRRRYTKVRDAIPPERRAAYDLAIFGHVTASVPYKKARMLLSYVSMRSEPDTTALLERARQDGKQVAVPRCVEGTREMRFYLIRSLADLMPGYYGVREPDPERCAEPAGLEGSLCLVPGLVFDGGGYRLGYGGGYYDRFLAAAPGVTAMGLCYRECVRHRMQRDLYDLPCAYVATQDGIMAAQAGEKGKSPRRGFSSGSDCQVM